MAQGISSSQPTTLLLTIPEACQALGGISRHQLWKLDTAGEITKVNIGSRAFITAASLTEYVNRLTQAAASA